MCSCCLSSKGPELSRAVRTFHKRLSALAVIRDPVSLPGKHEVSTDAQMGLLEYILLKREQNYRDPQDHIYTCQGVIEEWLNTKLPPPNYLGNC